MPGEFEDPPSDRLNLLLGTTSLFSEADREAAEAELAERKAAEEWEDVEEAIEELRAMEVAHEVLGGGRIQFEPEKKTIHIYGHSMGFPWQGEYRHDLSAKVCQEAYPDFAVTTSNEGY